MQTQARGRDAACRVSLPRCNKCNVFGRCRDAARHVSTNCLNCDFCDYNDEHGFIYDANTCLM